MKIGANHHFFRALRKPQNSLMMASLLIVMSFLAMKMHSPRADVKLYLAEAGQGCTASDKVAAPSPIS